MFPHCDFLCGWIGFPVSALIDEAKAFIAQGRDERGPKRLNRMFEVLYFLRRGAHDVWLEGEMFLDWNDYYPPDTGWRTVDNESNYDYDYIRRDLQEDADEDKAAGDRLHRPAEELASVWRPLQRRRLFGGA